MFTRQLLFVLALLVTGCGPTVSTQTETENGAPNATPLAGGNNTQTVEGSGFSLEVPADWNVQSLPSGVGVFSPLDTNNPNPVAPLQVTASIQPTFSLTSQDAMASLLKNHKSSFGDVESEAQTTVSGRGATKLVMTGDRRTVNVYVPLDAGLLLVQCFGPDDRVVAMMPQIDAIIASIKLK